MKINRAIGLGITILVLQWLVSDIFSGFERLLLHSFDTAEKVLDTASASVGSAPIPRIE